jgi:hypothetical protein
MMLNEDYRKRWETIVIRAQRRHVDWMELLDRERLLLTADREREIRTETVSAVLERFRQIKPFEFLDQVHGRGHAGSPDDMYRAIDQWLSQFLQAIRHT